MKKTTKLISIVLAFMLAACSFAVMPFAANAVETAKLSASDTATDDTATKDAVVDHIELAVSSIEIIKIPDKVFTAEFPNNDYWDKYMENHTMDEFYEDSRPISIAANMKGAQMQVTFNDGTVIVHTFDKPIYVFRSYLGTHNACYVLEDGKQFLVTDLGGYKAQVEFAGKTTVFEAKHAGSDNNGNNTTPTNLTDTPNGNLTTPTSSQVPSPDTATADTVKNGSSGTAGSGNGTIATGNNMCSLAAIIILVCAGGVMVFFNRKRYFKH